MNYITANLARLVKVVNRINIWKGIYAFLFSLMLIFSRHSIIDPYADSRNYESAVFTDLNLIDFIFLILATVLVYLIVNNIHLIKKDIFFEDKRTHKGIIQLIISFIVIALCYVPYLYSYWPGGIYSDTMNSIWIAIGTDPMTTHEPIGYTLLWTLMFKLAGGSLEPGDYGAFYMFTIVQSMGMALLLSLFINWNYRRGLKKSAAAMLTLIFALFPLFPYYGISLWKDTVFGMVIFIYAWNLYCIVERIENTQDVSKKDIILYIIISVLVVFFRNNGIYVMIMVSILLSLLYIKSKQLFKKLGITSIAIIIACLLIQHPLFDALNYNVDTAIESLAIPLQQTAYIVTTDGKVSAEDAEVINNIMRYEHWREVYDPIISDFIKFDGEFNREYFNNNVGKFMKTYLSLCVHNPVKAIKGYALSTAGYWDLFKDSSNAYICSETIAWTGIFQGDFFEYNTGKSFRSMVNPKHFIPAALWVWLMLLALAVVLSSKSKKKIVAVLPAFLVWLTIMLAVPIGFTFRYIFAVFLCMPIYFVSMMEE